MMGGIGMRESVRELVLRTATMSPLDLARRKSSAGQSHVLREGLLDARLPWPPRWAGTRGYQPRPGMCSDAANRGRQVSHVMSRRDCLLFWHAVRDAAWKVPIPHEWAR